MAELFRYIEQAFVAISDKQAIAVGRRSDLQDKLRDAVSERLPRDRLRSIADAFVAQYFHSRFDDPLQMGQQFRSFRKRLAQPLHGTDGINQLIAATFDSNAMDLVASDAFLADKALLDDILVAVKISTGFDRVNAHDLVATRQVIAFIEDVASGRRADRTAGATSAVLRLPIRIPTEFVYPVTPREEVPPSPPSDAPDESARQHAALLAEQQHFKRAYEMIMSLPPDQFEMRPVSRKADGHDAADNASGKETPGRGGCAYEMDAPSATPSFLAIPDAAIEQLGVDVKKTLERAKIDIAGAPVSHVISKIKRQWQDVSQQLAPYQAPVPTKVFRLGAHLFAVQDSAATIATGTREVQ